MFFSGRFNVFNLAGQSYVRHLSRHEPQTLECSPNSEGASLPSGGCLVFGYHENHFLCHDLSCFIVELGIFGNV